MKITRLNAKAARSKGTHFRVIPYYLGHLLIYLGLLIIALVITWLIIKVYRIKATYRVTTQHVAALEALGSAEQANSATLDLAKIEASLRGAATGLETLYEESTPFLALTPYLGWLPLYGDDFQALPHLLVAGRDLGQVGAMLIESFLPAARAGSETGRVINLSRAATRLAQAEAELEQAEVLLRRHQAIISALDVERLSPRVAGGARQLQHYLPRVISGLQLAQGLPLLYGLESAQTYLILTQNSDELRPTGGYINAAGHMVLDQGQMVEFVMQDSYAVDRLSEAYPYPPEPLYQYMAADYWVLRDASWWPDFPTTARTAIDLYELGMGISADGVIALDQQALPYLLLALEPLDVDGDRVTSQNVIKLMRRHWAPEPGQALDHQWWLQRKSFMLALAEAIHQKFEQNPGAINLLVLAEALQQALAEKHILIYLKDPTWADFLAARNWAGSWPSVQGDYLMVVDANVGFNKASAIVERALSYRIALAEDGGARVQAHLVYQHFGRKHRASCSKELRYDPVYEQNMDRCYWNYLQLIVPAGAQLSSGPGVVVAGQYLLRGQSTTGDIDVVSLGSDKVSWGQLFLLAPSESITLDYSYSLPPGTARFVEDRWVYQLYLQKQPGTLQPAVEVIVALPEGAQVLDSQPQPLSQQGVVITYQLSLKTDREIEIFYHLP